MVMANTEGSSKGTVDVVQEQLKALTNVFEGGLTTASAALKSSTATAKNEASKAMGVVQVGCVTWLGFLTSMYWWGVTSCLWRCRSRILTFSMRLIWLIT